MHRSEKYLLLLVNVIIRYKKPLSFILDMFMLFLILYEFKMHFDLSGSTLVALFKTIMFLVTTYFSVGITIWIRRLLSAEGEIKDADFNLLSKLSSLFVDAVSLDEFIGDAIEYGKDKKYPLLKTYFYLMPIVILRICSPVSKVISILSEWISQLASK